jgi:hypothetical protein
MKAHARLPQSQPVAFRRPAPNRYDPGCLAYEDVVSLATRLINHGYTEIGREFLAFANDPLGLTAVYGLEKESRTFVLKPSLSREFAASFAYLAAANLLVKSKTLRRDEVAQAVLLIAFGKADAGQAREEDPPMFTD